MTDAVRSGAVSRNESRYRGKGREWATPRTLYAQMDAEFGFTVDVCASDLNHKHPRYWTEAHNGLAQDWRREVCWMNPPYGAEIRAWIRKARESADAGATVVALLPSETDTDWWHDHILGRAEVRYIRGRIRFDVHHPDGSVQWASPFRPNVIIVWRPLDALAQPEGK